MIAYLDASAGVSGDMLLAAFLDAGLPPAALKKILRPLGLDAVEIHARPVSRGGLRAYQVAVHAPFGRTIFAPTAADFMRRIHSSRLEPTLKVRMIKTVKALAQAEGFAHGTDWRQAHFHQLSHVDTLVDIAGFCAGLIHFQIQTFYTSPIPIGNRSLDPHGRIDHKPGPAVVRLLRSLPVLRRAPAFEWTTPTGAALVAAWGVARPAPPFKITRIGQGVGCFVSPEGPKVLRLFLGEVALDTR